MNILAWPRLDATPTHREIWSRRYREVRGASLRLAAPLSPEDQQVQSMADASPVKWHLAHTTWFFEAFLLRPHAPGYQPYDDRYDTLFNSYYEAVGPRTPRAHRGLITRPSVAEVANYRHYVDTELQRLIGTAAAREWPTLMRLIELGLNHEQQHQELILMDVKHLLSCSPLQPSYIPRSGSSAVETSPARWIAFEGGLVEIGHAGHTFAFDNEAPRHRTWLDPFHLSSRLVTCGEYRAFMDDGAYRCARLWLSDGWDMIQTRGVAAPLYWQGSSSAWSVFTLHGSRPVIDDEPVVHVSYYEADAFARWSGRRLPTEAEWELAATAADQQLGRPDSSKMHPAPVGEKPGLVQMHGEAWQFTASPYAPYPGFVADAGALGEYNGKFMVNQMVLRGSACVTPRAHSRASYRNFYPASARWMFGGIRLGATRV